MAFLGWGGFSLDFKGSALLLALLAIILGVAALLSYRRTTPPSGLFIRIALGSLRCVVFILLILLIFEPTLSRFREKRLKPLLAVLIDDSESMKLKDASIDRSRQLQNLLKDASWKNLQDRFDLNYFALGDSLRPLNGLNFDSLHQRTIGTDLSSGWRSLPLRPEGADYAGIVLISDGGDNVGRDPVQAASETSQPIFTVGIGDTARARDAGIASLTGDPVAYRGKKTALTVRVKARGSEGTAARLELTGSDGQVLSAVALKLPPDDLEAEAILEFIPDRVGTVPLNLRLSPSEGESSKENNTRSYALEVKESRIRVLFISGEPNFESMFLLRAASRLPDLEFTTLTVKSDGTLFGGGSVDLLKLVGNSDLLILMDLSGQNRTREILSRVQQALQVKPLPLWIWIGDTPPTDDLKALAGGLPFTAYPARRSLFARAVPDRFYPVLDPDAQNSETPQWDDLPPLQSPPLNIRPDNSAAQLIGLKDAQTGQDLCPALITWEKGTKRCAATFGSGYWRWSFVNQGLSGSDQFYSDFLLRMVRYLAASPDTRTLRLLVNKKLFSIGENAQFTARVFGGDGKYLSTPSVGITIDEPDGQSKLMLEADQNGLYKGTFQPDAIGNYGFRGWATTDKDTLGADSGKFLVEGYNVEKETLNQNRPLLEAIAKSSGGAYYPADSLVKFAVTFNAPARIKTVGWQRRFFLNWDIWMVLVILLGLEWLIRKRRGML